MKVYLIGNTDYGFYKIGVTKDEVKWRMKAVDSPRLPFELKVLAEVEVGSAAFFVEKNLHVFYKKNNVRGEWFVAIKPKYFVRKAKQLFIDYVPKPKRAYVDPYAGTRWGRRPSNERAAIVISLRHLSVEEAKKLMAEEMKKENA